MGVLAEFHLGWGGPRGEWVDTPHPTPTGPRRAIFGPAQKYISPGGTRCAILVTKWGFQAFFENVEKRVKKTAALIMACNGISLKGYECAPMPCMLSSAVENCAKGVEQNLAQSLTGRGGGGLEPLPHTLVLSSSVELWVLGAVSDFPKLAPPMDPHR